LYDVSQGALDEGGGEVGKGEKERRKEGKKERRREGEKERRREGEKERRRKGKKMGVLVEMLYWSW
jgi:hypothetical protein